MMPRTLHDAIGWWSTCQRKFGRCQSNSLLLCSVCDCVVFRLKTIEMGSTFILKWRAQWMRNAGWNYSQTTPPFARSRNWFLTSTVENKWIFHSKLMRREPPSFVSCCFWTSHLRRYHYFICKQTPLSPSAPAIQKANNTTENGEISCRR